MKRILFIIPGLEVGGTNSALDGIYNAIHDRFEVTVLAISPYGNGNYSFKKILIVSDLLTSLVEDFGKLNKRQRIYACILKPLKRLCVSVERLIYKLITKHINQNIKPDIVVGFQESYATKIASYFPCPKKIAWIHSDIGRSVVAVDKERLLYSCFDKIVCVSSFTYDSFKKRHPALSGRTMTINNLFDEKNVIEKSLLPVDDNRFSCDGFTIVSAGRMDVVKQFTIIPKIAKEMDSYGLKFKWYILGGPENEEYRLIEKYIKDNEVEEKVILLGNKTNPYPYFKHSDLYVSTSMSEACPMVFCEARLCGIPIISNNFGSASEFVSNGYDGFIGSLDEFPKIISGLISNKDLYEKIKKGSKSYTFPNADNINKLKCLFD